MNVPSADMLRVLGAGVRPGGAPEPILAGAPDFAELLGRAREGTLETGLPVQLATGSGLDLTAAQLDRLAGVVDRAHAEGASRIVVLMDGMALDVDVLSRRILGPAELADGKVLTGVDGVVSLEQRTDQLPVALPTPGLGVVDASVARLLGERESDGAA